MHEVQHHFNTPSLCHQDLRATLCAGIWGMKIIHHTIISIANRLVDYKILPKAPIPEPASPLRQLQVVHALIMRLLSPPLA